MKRAQHYSSFSSPEKETLTAAIISINSSPPFIVHYRQPYSPSRHLPSLFSITVALLRSRFESSSFALQVMSSTPLHASSLEIPVFIGLHRVSSIQPCRSSGSTNFRCSLRSQVSPSHSRHSKPPSTEQRAEPRIQAILFCKPQASISESVPSS